MSDGLGAGAGAAVAAEIGPDGVGATAGFEIGLGTLRALVQLQGEQSWRERSRLNEAVYVADPLILPVNLQTGQVLSDGIFTNDNMGPVRGWTWHVPFISFLAAGTGGLATLTGVFTNRGCAPQDQIGVGVLTNAAAPVEYRPTGFFLKYPAKLTVQVSAITNPGVVLVARPIVIRDDFVGAYLL